MADGESGLDEKARGFAEDLTSTVRALVTDCAEFAATRLEADGHVWVRQVPDTGIPLRVDGDPILTLKVSLYCGWDSARQYLAVERSDIHVFEGTAAKGEPLFRFEYRRTMSSDAPVAHLQLHAHSDA